jgi:hypothetical protein
MSIQRNQRERARLLRAMERARTSAEKAAARTAFLNFCKTEGSEQYDAAKQRAPFKRFG